MNVPALRIENLHKSYGSRQVLCGVELEVQPGEVLALLGVNGAGKTTLLSIVTGLLSADAGRVRVCGHDPARSPLAAKRHIGFASQEISLYPVLTVRENLRYFAELRGLRGQALTAQISTAAAALELQDLMDRAVGPLSGGEKRRVHAAIAFVGERSLLLLDEPTAGSDVETRGRLLRMVRERAKTGACIVYSTHYLDEVEELDASVAILEGGSIIARGSLGSLVKAHGRSMVEVAFHEPPRQLPGGAVVLDEISCRVPTDDPSHVVSQLHELGATSNLRSIEIVRPSLESVFLELTGRRFDAEGVPAFPAGRAT